jgi:type I restriction enzyme S subunit
VKKRSNLSSATHPAQPDTVLPKGWAEATLEHLLASLESGSRPKGGVRGIEGGIPSVGAEHLNPDGGFRFEKVKFVPEDFFRRMNRGVIKCGDVLVVKDGATTGKASLVRADFPYSDAVVNEHVFVCRPAEGVESAFLFLYLFSKEGQERILENFQGSAQGGINQGFAKGTTVPLAPLAEQKRIVAKVEELLARVNAAREHLAKVPAILKRFRQSVLAAACSGRLTEEWREAVGASEWEEKSLGEMTELVTSGSRGWAKHYSDTGALFIRAQNLSLDRLDLTDVAHVQLPVKGEGMRTLVSVNDILVTITGANVTKTALVSERVGEAYVNQHVALVRLLKPEHSPYVWLWLISPEHGRSQLLDAAYGAGVPGLNLRQIREVSVLLPSHGEQQEIVRRVNELFALANSIEKQAAAGTARVEKLTQAILAKAFRGELIPQDPDDEPASILLDRIRIAREAGSKPSKVKRGER